MRRFVGNDSFTTPSDVTPEVVVGSFQPLRVITPPGGGMVFLSLDGKIAGGVGVGMDVARKIAADYKGEQRTSEPEIREVPRDPEVVKLIQDCDKISEIALRLQVNRLLAADWSHDEILSFYRGVVRNRDKAVDETEQVERVELSEPDNMNLIHEMYAFGKKEKKELWKKKPRPKMY